MTPISQTQAPLPDPRVQTEKLRSELDAVFSDLRQSAGSLAPIIATEACHMRDALVAPAEAYPGLAELDKALTEAIRSLCTLAGAADAEEAQQATKSLRRILLVDRRRFDPDPETTSLSLAIALRKLWLIPCQAELLRSHQKLQQISRLLEEPDVSPDLLNNRLQTRTLLNQYISTLEDYDASVRLELEELFRQQLQ